MHGRPSLASDLKVVAFKDPGTLNDAGEGVLAAVADTRNFDEALLQVHAVNSAGTTPVLSVYPIVGGASEALKTYTAASSGFQTLRASSSAGIGISFQMSAPAKPGSQIETVSLFLKRLGTVAATKKVQVQVDSDSSGLPATVDGTLDKSGVLGSSDKLEAADISTDGAWYTFTFATPVPVGNAAVLHIAVVGDYTESGTDAIQVAYTTVSSGGDYESRTNTTWTNTATRNVLSLVSGTQFNYLLEDDGVTNRKASATTGTTLTSISIGRNELAMKLRLLYVVSGTDTPAWTGSIVVILGNARNSPAN